jgi:hypothetical protein
MSSRRRSRCRRRRGTTCISAPVRCRRAATNPAMAAAAEAAEEIARGGGNGGSARDFAGASLARVAATKLESAPKQLSPQVPARWSSVQSPSWNQACSLSKSHHSEVDLSLTVCSSSKRLTARALCSSTISARRSGELPPSPLSTGQRPKLVGNLLLSGTEFTEDTGSTKEFLCFIVQSSE